MNHQQLRKEDFGNDFVWGIAMSAFQNEGAWNEGNKSESIWDRFSHKKNRILDKTNADVTTDFYHRYREDIRLTKELGFEVFRFSFAWSRILPNGIGTVNHEGIDFYHKVIDTCLEFGLEPWPTIYHWDLPQILEDMGGWTNRHIVDWFVEYCEVLTEEFGSKVKHWMVLNEPAGFTGLGYMTGYHAPGRMGMSNFLPAVHHTALCQAEGARVIRRNVSDAVIGTTFSCSHIEPHTHRFADIKAAQKVDALLNRLFLEPALGLGYPIEDLPFLKTMMKKHVFEGDMERLAFDFDFIGIQNYFKLVMKGAWWMPYINAMEVKPHKRGVQHTTDLGWEVSPDGMYEIIKKFASYPQIKQLIITENGAAFKDTLRHGEVHDPERTAFYQTYLHSILKAKQEGINLGGYLAWTLTDNFEWREGYQPKFGLVYVDFESQERIVKSSGKWFKEFLTATKKQKQADILVSEKVIC